MKEKVAQLEDLAQKREKSIQSTKMVVRFRENTISRLEKAKKEGAAQDDKDKTIVSRFIYIIGYHSSTWLSQNCVTSSHFKRIRLRSSTQMVIVQHVGV